MRPASSGILSATWSPIPMRSAACEDDRPQVERHLAALGRHAVAATLEHLNERRVRLLERDPEEILEAPAARARD